MDQSSDPYAAFSAPVSGQSTDPYGGFSTPQAPTPPAVAPAAAAPPAPPAAPTYTPYPTQTRVGDLAGSKYVPNKAQSDTAYRLAQSGQMDDSADPGTAKYPLIAMPGRPVPTGQYMIDQAGVLRVAGENDDGAPQATPSPPTSVWGAALQRMTGLSPVPQRGMGDVLPAYVSGLYKGAAGFIDPALSAIFPQPAFLNGPPKFGTTPRSIYPNFSDVIHGIGADYSPTTNAGRYAQTVGEFTPNAAMPAEAPASILSKFAQVALPAVGSQAATDAASAAGAPEWAQKAAGVAGALVGGYGAAGRLPFTGQGTTLTAPLKAIETASGLDKVDPATIAANLSKGQLPVAAGHPGLTALGENVANSAGPGRAILTSAIDQRRAGDPGRVMDAVTNTLGVDPTAAAGNVNGIVDAGKAAAAPLFEAALTPSQPRGLMTPDLARLSAEPEVATAIATSKRLLGSNATAPGIKIDPDTGLQVLDPKTQQPVIEQQLTPEAWDVARKMLNKSIALDPDGKMIDSGPTGVTNLLRQRWSQDLTNQLAGDENGNGAAIPGYRQALDTAGDYIKTRQAFDNASGTLFNGPVSRFQGLWDSASTPQEQDAIRAALANDVLNQNNRGLLQPGSFRQPGVQQKLQTAFGDSANDFISQMESAAQERKTLNGITTGSPTQYRQSLDAAFSKKPGGITLGAAAEWALSASHPGILATKVARMGAGALSKPPVKPWDDPETSAALAQMLSDPGAMQSALSRIQGAKASAAFQRGAAMRKLPLLAAPAVSASTAPQQ